MDGNASGNEFSTTDRTQLTERNVDVFEHGDAAQGSSRPTYKEISKHWDGVKDFNKECLFNLDFDLREHASSKRWSDSSDDYSHFIKQADVARESEDPERRNSLKLYKDSQSTALPHERWGTPTRGWPDQVHALGHSEAHDVEPTAGSVQEASVEAEVHILKRAHGTVEIDEEAENEEELAIEPSTLEQARKKIRRVEPGKFRVHKEKGFRIRK